MEVEEEIMNKGVKETMDWKPTREENLITKLPDHLLLNIISFLPIKDAINTSLLSKKWRFLWTLTPNLDFDQRLIIPQNPSFSESRKLFANFIDRALLLYQGSSIQRLRIWFDFDPDLFESHIDSWIRFEIRRNVIELDLDLSGDMRDPEFSYTTPYFLNEASLIRGSVRVLKVCFGGLYPPPYYRFPSITTVHLKQYALMDHTIPDLFTFCPQLENLVLDSVFGEMLHLKICSAKLKTLSIMNYERDGEITSVDILAPNLVSFSCINYIADEYTLKDVSSLEEAVVLFPQQDDKFFPHWSKIIKFLGHVRSLKVQNLWGMQHPQQNGECSEKICPSKFRYLELVTGLSEMELLGIARILRLSPNLEIMVLQMVVKTDDNVSQEIYTTDFLEKLLTGSPICLKKLKITSFMATDNELELLKYLLKYGLTLEKIILVPSKTGLASVPPQHFAERFQELQAFPRSSQSAEIFSF
ncbi:putative F-box/LRR-repeat protein At4g15060 isoform X2 [Tasmannia lanceolata]|uniref:putative F-box/LRR-repeat protein At4g15060 isoform X2 n=1 Tax=Tasmannia lanceolata TaxID=3420 RepID=UPI0040628664